MKRNTTRRRKAGFSLITLVTVLFILEGISRLFISNADVQTYQEHAAIIRVLGLPALNEILEPDHHSFWKLKNQPHPVRVSGTVGDLKIDFSVTVRDGLRSPKIGTTKQRLRILALGDSCTFGLGVDDDQTWPAQLQQLLVKDSVAATVINAGVPGYTAYQGKTFLETRGLELLPDIVVVSFGFNDRDTWASRSDMEMAGTLASGRLGSILLHSRFYVGLKRWLHTDPLTEKKRRLSSRPRLSEKEFYDTLAEINQLCETRKIPCVLMIWPFAGQVAQRQNEALWYQIVTTSAARRLNIPLVNLVPEFIRADGPLFIDHIHANKDGGQIAAAEVYRTIRPLLRDLPE